MIKIYNFKTDCKGFSLAEIMVSAVFMSAISLTIAESFNELNKLDVKLLSQIKKVEQSKNLSGLLIDESVCLANFNNLSVSANIKGTNLFIDPKKLINYKNLDPNYDSHILKLGSKTSFYEDVYSAELEIISKDLTTKPMLIPLFLKVQSGKIASCSSLYGTNYQPKPNSPCNANNIGATRYDKSRSLALICNGKNYKPIESYGGMYKISYNSGNTYCDYKNPLTNDCTCPSGYVKAGGMGFGQGAHGDGDDCPKDDGIMNYRYDPEDESFVKVTDKTRGCGFNMVVCFVQPD